MEIDRYNAASGLIIGRNHRSNTKTLHFKAFSKPADGTGKKNLWQITKRGEGFNMSKLIKELGTAATPAEYYLWYIISVMRCHGATLETVIRELTIPYRTKQTRDRKTVLIRNIYSQLQREAENE